MKVVVNKLPGSKVEIKVEIPSTQMDMYFETAASNLSKDMKVDGFRPGKVPIEIVEKEKGSQKVYEEAANLAIQRTLAKAILDNKIEIVGQPVDITVLKVARGDSMEYRAVFWVIPEVVLGQYKGLEIKKREIKIEDKEVDKALEYLQNSRAKYVTVNRPAQSGDRVEIDFVTRCGGVKIEGGEDKNHPLIVGKGSFIPGFEKQLEGMKSGEEKNFSLVVPNDWPQKNLAGKKLDFEIKMNLVQKREIPSLNDEFARSLGKFDSLNHLKKSIKNGLFQEKEIKEKERIRLELIEKAAADSKVEIPEILIDIEIEKMIDELRNSTQSMGLSFENYLKSINKTIEDLKKEFKPKAEKRVKIGLVLKTIAEKENIKVSEEEVTEKINETLKYYSSIEEARKNIDLEALKHYTENVIKNEKVFELLEKNAKIK